MARFEFKLPDIGEGVTEGEVVTWHVKVGDRVAEDQVMVEVMTDKATVTIGAPKQGKIAELRAEVGAVVQVGDVLLVIQTGNGSRAHGGKASQMPAATAVGEIQDVLPGTDYFAERRAQVEESRGGSPAVVEPAEHFDDRPLATPATRKLARDLKVDLRQVVPTGDGGRVSKEDVKRAADGGAEIASVTMLPPATLRPAPDLKRTEKRIPFVGMRRRIAENMRLSKSTAAHFAFVEECNVDRLMDLRKRLQPGASARGAELSYLPFVIKAVTAALKKHPMLNCMLDTDTNELVLYGSCHIGIAAATDSGLVVPVIHDAQDMSLIEIALEVQRLGEAARDGKLTVSDLSGSTFTITSLGKQSGLFAIPIINFPNVGILGVHRMKQRPIVRDGEIVIGNVMLLSLSLDHRIVDGHVGAAFAYDVIAYLEEPALMLLDL